MCLGANLYRRQEPESISNSVWLVVSGQEIEKLLLGTCPEAWSLPLTLCDVAIDINIDLNRDMDVHTIIAYVKQLSVV